MKKMKWVIGAIAATAVFAGIIWIVAISINPQGDENVQAYKKALAESMGGEFYHYTKTERVSTVNGEWYENDKEECYKCDSDLLLLNYYGNDIYYDLNFNGYNFFAKISDAEKNVNRHDHEQAINIMDHFSYYSIYDKDVTYEETDTQFIVTFVNRALIGEELKRPYYEEDKDGYTSAVSVAYFDKDWNIQRLEIRETWDSISEEGKEYERVREVAYEYHDTSKEEIEKKFAETYNLLNSLLEE